MIHLQACVSTAPVSLRWAPQSSVLYWTLKNKSSCLRLIWRIHLLSEEGSVLVDRLLRVSPMLTLTIEPLLLPVFSPPHPVIAPLSFPPSLFTILCLFTLLFSLCSSPLSLIILSSFLLFALSDFKFRVGRGQRRHQEDAEWRAARRERESGPRQIQNAATDPTGQHKAAHRRVRVHVRTTPLSPPLYPTLSLIKGVSSRTQRLLDFHGQQMLPSFSTPPPGESSWQKLPKSCPSSLVRSCLHATKSEQTSPYCRDRLWSSNQNGSYWIFLFVFWTNMAIESLLLCFLFVFAWNLYAKVQYNSTSSV